uniref:dipeptidase n=1 Tax=uncultured Sphingomonas sp. TaxID=158754 RepID=UPI0035C9FA72
MRTGRAAMVAAGVAIVAMATPAVAQKYDARIDRVLKATPLIDGHNDWAEALREREGDGRWTLDLTHGLDAKPVPYNTDIALLRKGRVGGQFWSVWVDADLPGPEQVKQTLEQIDLVHQIVARYPDTFALARTAADVRRIHKTGRIASLIGVEGGGQIDDSLAVLRTYRDLGASYLTLTHVKTIGWADSATDNPRHDGLTPFGESVVRELNRLGMLVDLAHVSETTMISAIRVSKAPVIFSHSSARALDDHPRDVSDAVLKLLPANGGVVMVNFAPIYISDAYRRWSAEQDAERTRLNAPPYGGLYVGQPDKAAAALAEWQKAHPKPRVTLSDVADHIEHIVKVAGIDHVGIGSDFDGVGNSLPEGLGDVGTYPALLAELMRRGWSDASVAKLAGGNILRVMEAAERVAASLERRPHIAA